MCRSILKEKETMRNTEIPINGWLLSIPLLLLWASVECSSQEPQKRPAKAKIEFKVQCQMLYKKTSEACKELLDLHGEECAEKTIPKGFIFGSFSTSDFINCVISKEP